MARSIRPESSPGYCRDHAGVRAADNAFYAALANRARRSPAFLGWDLWSEPHVINWANPTWIPNPEFCFCPHTIRRFRGWLQAKYGSLEALNEAWYRRFSNWDQVEPGRMSTILSYTDYIDWKTFIADKLGEDLHDRYQAVKQVAPSTIVTSHAAGVGLFASPHHWEGQADDWTMAREGGFLRDVVLSEALGVRRSRRAVARGAASTSRDRSATTGAGRASGWASCRAASARSP